VFCGASSTTRTSCVSAIVRSSSSQTRSREEGGGAGKRGRKSDTARKDQRG
jgi:hypothetical protein